MLSLMVGEWSTSFRLLCYVGPFILAADINPHEVLKLLCFNFYPRDAMLARVIAIATCLSVCPSRAGIVSKRRKLAA